MNAHRTVRADDDAREVRALLAGSNRVLVEDVRSDADVQAEGRALLATLLNGDTQRVRASTRRSPSRSVHRVRPARRLLVRAGGLVAITAAVLVAVLALGVVPLPWNQTVPAAGAYAATPPPLVYAPVAGSAPQVLEQIAARTAALPDDAGEGRYARIETQEWSLFTRVGGDDHTVTSMVMPQQATSWRAADGAGREVVRYQQHGIPWTTTDETTYEAGERGAAWPTLSPDDATLAEQLAKGHPTSNGPAERLVAINDYLREQPLQPDVRAAVLRYLAATPTLELSGRTTDRLGREGIAFSLESDYSGLPTRYTLIVDPKNGRFLAGEEMLTTTAGKLNVPIPSVIGYTAYRNSTHTDSTQN